MTTITAQYPRLIPGAVAVILGGTLLCATAARVVNFAAPPSPPPALASLALTFTDLGNGGVAVRNAATGQLAATVAARNDGFLRMTLRLLAAARERQNIGQSQPFELTEFAGGRMRLSDPATGLAVELEAFGPSNVGEFTRLFTPETHS
jgi:putative photosynthetic complex assembly protein